MTPALRTCLGCRRTATKAELVRLAWDGTSGRVVADVRQVLPGRGCYVHPACAEATAKRRVVGRALRRAVDAYQVSGLLAALAADGPA